MVADANDSSCLKVCPPRLCDMYDFHVLDTSKGELPLLYPSPPIKQRTGGDAVQPPPRQKPAEDRLIAAASTDEEDEGGSGGGSQGLSALEVGQYILSYTICCIFFLVFSVLAFYSTEVMSFNLL